MQTRPPSADLPKASGKRLAKTRLPSKSKRETATCLAAALLSSSRETPLSAEVVAGFGGAAYVQASPSYWSWGLAGKCSYAPAAARIVKDRSVDSPRTNSGRLSPGPRSVVRYRTGTAASPARGEFRSGSSHCTRSRGTGPPPGSDMLARSVQLPGCPAVGYTGCTPRVLDGLRTLIRSRFQPVSNCIGNRPPSCSGSRVPFSHTTTGWPDSTTKATSLDFAACRYVWAYAAAPAQRPAASSTTIFVTPGRTSSE